MNSNNNNNNNNNTNPTGTSASGTSLTDTIKGYANMAQAKGMEAYHMAQDQLHSVTAQAKANTVTSQNANPESLNANRDMGTNQGQGQVPQMNSAPNSGAFADVKQFAASNQQPQQPPLQGSTGGYTNIKSPNNNHHL
ncbi:hypothetical protein BGZ54_003729 [Gamsiella multidivaricata]|nr:hypothetical protein BGZ54_003729 [Gamsiella multidivaricata]